MPIFGARMVCDSGNYKHIKERNRAELERETNLGKYENKMQGFGVELKVCSKETDTYKIDL